MQAPGRANRFSFRRGDPFRDGNGNPFTRYANYSDPARNAQAFDAGIAWLKFGAAPGARQRVEIAYTRQRSGEILYAALMMDAMCDNADRLSASWTNARVRAQAFTRACGTDDRRRRPGYAVLNAKAGIHAGEINLTVGRITCSIASTTSTSLFSATRSGWEFGCRNLAGACI